MLDHRHGLRRLRWNDRPVHVPRLHSSADLAPGKGIGRLVVWRVTFWMRDEEKFKKLYPMSVRTQSHDIIRTWAFYTILREYLSPGRSRGRTS